MPALASALDRVIEQVLFVRNAWAGAEGLLKDILVVEMVRSLDKAHFGVCGKWDGLRQKCRHRNMVCVEHHDQFAIRLRQGVVQVACFRMLTRALDVGRPEPFSQPADLFSMAIIQHENPFVTVFHRGGSDQGLFQNLAGLGIDWDEDVDRGSEALRWLRGTDSLTSPAYPYLDEQQHDSGEGIEFGRPQGHTDKQAAGFQEVQRMEEPPVEIVETEAEPAEQKDELENWMPPGDDVEYDGDGKEFPGEVRREPDHVERSQESQELVVVAGLRQGDGLSEPQPVLEIVGKSFPRECAGFERGEFFSLSRRARSCCSWKARA